MTEAMPFLQKYDITFLRPPTIRRGIFILFLSFFLSFFFVASGGLLSFPKGRGVPRPGAGCLRRVTFFPERK